MNTTTTPEAQRAILESQIQQATNTAFAASSLAKAFVEAGLTEEGKTKAEEASKYERPLKQVRWHLNSLTHEPRRIPRNRRTS
jgi:hypothetical protein